MPQSATDPSPASNGSHKPTPAIDASQVVEMTNDFFTTMLGWTVTPSPIPNTESFDDCVQASILVAGDWNAKVAILGSETLTQQIASEMFAIPIEELETSETQDAFGEVVNVIGGNAKGIVGGESKLSLPCGGPANMNLQDHSLVCQFDCNGSPFTVVITEHPADSSNNE